MNDILPTYMSMPPVVPPSTILKRIAGQFSDKTGGYVTAKTINQNAAGNQSFCYIFRLVVPNLGNYSYRLFTVVFEMHLYPLDICIDDQLANHLGVTNWEDGTYYIRAANEVEFEETLRGIFSSEYVTRIVTALIAQAKDGSDNNEADWH